MVFGGAFRLINVHLVPFNVEWVHFSLDGLSRLHAIYGWMILLGICFGVLLFLGADNRVH